MLTSSPRQRFSAYMARRPQGDAQADHVRAYHLDRVAAPRVKFMRDFAEAITDWRLMSGPPLRNDQRGRLERELIRAAVAEILEIRLTAAYAPILTTLERIERRVGILADLRREPWAPAAHPVNRTPQQIRV